MREISYECSSRRKKGSKKQRQPVISPDSAQSKTFIKVLYGLAEGEIEGLANGLQSIYLEETPLQNADGSLNFENVKLILEMVLMIRNTLKASRQLKMKSRLT